ncbi:hypothetical protein SISNIDRAFT_469411 [Sistotremastrum niveocremeum HHB9708]|uniref:F-box domain-containing protein n=1 Tax=Sistotremastrum niveocremeum HHB9708 TaxID=1314777 RepID=A0A164Q6S8_9AGAM|nr:hypothetical protein SISNIDRAFT_469411 [Sistotremastrum niveocremeum HHB9708]
MNAFFNNHYLLSLTFEHNSQIDLARLGRVSKSVSEPALDALYRKLQNPLVLFSLLSPLDLERNTLIFKLQINATDWDRFQFYSRRVRVLTYTANKNGLISPKLWNDIALTSPSKAIFPGMHSLHWFSGAAVHLAQYSLLLMHEGLTCLEIEGWDEPARLFRGVSKMAPQLRKLQLHSSNRTRDAADEREIIFLIENVRTLQEITVPLPLVNTKTMDVLSTAPSLKRISWSERSRADEQARNIPSCSPNFVEGSFQSLKHLDQIFDLRTLCGTPASLWYPQNLSALQCLIRVHESPGSLIKGFKTICRTFPSLRRLVIRLSLDDVDALHPVPTNGALRPFMALKRMQEFTLLIPVAVNLTMVDDDLDQLAKSWPSLKTFEISYAEPDLSHAIFTPLTLAALFPFAEHCPRLRKLHLHVRTDLPVSRQSTPTTRFSKTFSTLTLGCPVIPNPLITAMILSRISGPNLKVVRCKHHIISPQGRESWAEFAKLLESFVTARGEERTRASSLAGELAGLKGANLNNGFPLPNSVQQDPA